MRFRIGSALVALALAVSVGTVALAQADDGTSLFLTLVDPVEQDLEVPLETAQLTIQGTTLPGAVVSIDGELVDTDDQGNFTGVTALDEGANEIEVIASDGDGNQVNTSIFVTRGE